jgi:integrase
MPDTDEARRRRRATVNRVLGMLKAALNRAWRDGKVGSDDAWRRVEPFKQAVAARVRYLTIAEAQRLINACEPGFRELVQAALATGGRYGELIALRVADFDPDAGTLTVRMAKNGRGRHIVLADEGISRFRSLATGKPGAALLLAKPDGEPWKRTQQTFWMARACARARIDPPIGFHGLRHTWASLAVMAGMPLMVVARQLGHADFRMIVQHYGHLAPDFVNQAIRAGAPKFGIEPDRKVASI